MGNNYSFSSNLLLTLFCTCFLLASCSEEDEGATDDPVGDPIHGEWTLIEDGDKDCPDPENNYVDINDCSTGEGMCVTRIFNDDGTYTIQGDFTEEGTYTVSGDIITFCEGDDCDEYDFTIDNDVLTLSRGATGSCTYYTVWSK